MVKKRKRRKTVPDGKVSIQETQYLGYKSHVILNAETGLITTLEPTGGSAADNKLLQALLAHHVQVSAPAAIYAGDKAYDDTDQHYRLWQQGKYSALRLNDYRTALNSDHREYWLQVQGSPEYQAGLSER